MRSLTFAEHENALRVILGSAPRKVHPPRERRPEVSAPYYPGRCCELATRAPYGACVCEVLWDCQTHGRRHAGSHE